ncbi:hypothetical protein [Aneurinibacillus terranovensis]|uniref:hypothetical protein n=1 Tax=Aneurinibacillus terranovensis TaxID=278991 RepID=UPI000423DF31|nr:hypothetical protein [Aneurinibacillus terranovensis]
MKKIFSFASIGMAGVAAVAMASSAFAATITTSPSTSSSSAAKQEASAHKHTGHFDNQELLSLLKLDATTLQQDVKGGKSLADIAAAQGVQEQQVIDLLVNQASQRLDKAVQAGKLTQAQADQKKADLPNQMKKMVENKGGFGFRGEHEGREGSFNDVASVLGMNAQDVLTQLQSGKTLVQIANSKGVSEDDLLNKLLQKDKERLTKMVEQTWQDKDRGAKAADNSTANTDNSTANTNNSATTTDNSATSTDNSATNTNNGATTDTSSSSL